jgi:hypothetical protein
MKSFKSIHLGNFLCAFHIICIVLDGVNNFSSTLQHFGGGKLVSLIVKVLSNLPIPVVTTITTIVPLWNCYIDNYVYTIFGFVNK